MEKMFVYIQICRREESGKIMRSREVRQMANNGHRSGKGKDSTGIVQSSTIEVQYELQGVTGKQSRMLQCPDVVDKKKEDARPIAQDFAASELARIYPKRRIKKIKVINL